MVDAMIVRHALIIQLYLRIDRLDLAQKQLKTMKSHDEDSILSMLSTAWVNLSTVSKYSNPVNSMVMGVRNDMTTGWSKSPRSSVYIRRAD